MILVEKQENLALFRGFLLSSYSVLEKHILALAYSAQWKEFTPGLDIQSIASLSELRTDPEIIEYSPDPNVQAFRSILAKQMEIITQLGCTEGDFFDESEIDFDERPDNKDFYYQDYQQLLQDTFSFMVGTIIDCFEVCINALEYETGLQLRTLTRGDIGALREYADVEMNLIFDFIEVSNLGLEQLMKQNPDIL